MEVIISHVSADFDALASMVGASKLYPQAQMYFTGSPDQNVKEFMALYKDYLPIKYVRGDIRKLDISRLIIVDTRVPGRLGDFRDLVNDPQVEIHLYDHHPPTQETIVGDVNVVEMLGATATYFIRIIKEKELPLTPLEATVMALGIYEETGAMTFAGTTREDVDAVSFLLERKANLEVVSQFIHHTLTMAQRELLNDLLISSEVHNIHGFQILICSAATERYVDELAMLTHRVMDIERRDAVFTMVKMGERLYMVGRSRQSSVNVEAVLARFGGGGHPTAASASIKRAHLEDTRLELLEVLNAQVKPLKTARDIMSYPVWTINLEVERTMVDAQEALIRFGHSSLVVMEGNRPVGIISRKDVDKALHHGYGNAPISTYMSKPIHTVQVGEPLTRVQRMMINEDIGRIPVMDGEELAGFITRTDVLRSLHGVTDTLRPEIGRRVTDRIEHLPIFVRDLLYKAGEVADAEGINVFAVGGFVRDLLLGMENLDLDLVVEGDGIHYAEILAGILHGRVRSHQKFGTAVMILPDGFKMDVATSRSEYYTRPAALPEVMDSSIKQDLYRRDFSINAMAIKINRAEFGKLIDFFGGQRDLRSGIIRVLHNLSFVEDPTRIFRAIRYEQRYHFKIDQQTGSLIKEAINEQILEQMPNERIRDEIILILNEPRPLAALKRMESLKITRLIHPRIHLNSKLVEIIEEVTNVLVQFEPLLDGHKIERWLIYFMALISQLSLEEIQEIAGRYKITAQQARKLTFDRKESTQLIRQLSLKRMPPSKITRLLSPLSIEVLLYLVARTRMRVVKQRIARYLGSWRKIKPLVKGRDLEDWGHSPGPCFKELLDFLFDAQMDGRFETRAAARTLAEEWVATARKTIKT